MITKVGLQPYFVSALKDLIELDYDAIEAYEVAIKKLEQQEYKEKLAEFKADHERHVEEINNILHKHGESTPSGPSNKQWLTKGKVVLANLIGEKAILTAMLSNEEDTSTAYERLTQHQGKWHDSELTLSRGLEDEKKHKKWLEGVLETM